LWSQDAPFTLALPINVLVGIGSDRTASTCWVGCRIQPARHGDLAAELRGLRTPGEWFMLNDPRRAKELENAPVVVRLNGCPLVSLPGLVGSDGRWTEFCEQILRTIDVRPRPAPTTPPGRQPVQVEHAVLVDEYAAMQLAAIELYTVHGGQADLNIRYGIPTAIAGVTTDSHARFWMVLGVQIGDSVVRYRFASQIASAGMAAVQKPNSVAPEHAGLVVNRRVDAGAHDLLHWYGFDVVKDDCESFHEDLDHYIEHLRAPHRRSRPDEECDIR
jgi:hypothetical protein